MKNLLIYISPTFSFNNPGDDLVSNDAGKLVKVQIDNSLALGWQKKDIILVTNFDYQYGTTRAIVLKDVEFYERKPQASKINAIVRMFEKKLIKPHETYWFHDLDAFQLMPFTKNEIDMTDKEIALAPYSGIIFSGIEKWQTGSIFFKAGSRDIFARIKEVMYEKKVDDKKALCLITISDTKLRKRIKKINYTYNFTGYNLSSAYQKAVKPLKVVHFHPQTGNPRLATDNNYMFFRGQNKLNTLLITRQLIKMFKYHRIG